MVLTLKTSLKKRNKLNKEHSLQKFWLFFKVPLKLKTQFYENDVFNMLLWLFSDDDTGHILRKLGLKFHF